LSEFAGSPVPATWPSRIHFRPLGEGAVIFDEQTWLTHILTPAARIICEHLAEHAAAGTLTTQQAVQLLRDDLDADVNSADIEELLRTLRAIGLIVE